MRRLKRSLFNGWPSWRYGPDGVGAIFQTEAEVPVGWTRKPGVPEVPYVHKGPTLYDRSKLIEELIDLGITPNPLWGNAHMKKVIDDCTATR